MEPDDKKSGTLYTPLPTQLGGNNTRPVAAAISSLLPYPSGSVVLREGTINNYIRHRGLTLDGYSDSRRPLNLYLSTAPPPSNLTAEKSRRNQHLSSAEYAIGGRTLKCTKHIRDKRRRAGEHKLVLPEAERHYELYEPLHRAWRTYCHRIMTIDEAGFTDRVLRMDWHGAIVSVVRSRDPTLVGQRGIVIAETANTLLLITTRDRTITIPKSVSVIEMVMGERRVEVFLPSLAFRASERSARKVKKKHMPHI